MAKLIAGQPHVRVIYAAGGHEENTRPQAAGTPVAPAAGSRPPRSGGENRAAAWSESFALRRCQDCNARLDPIPSYCAHCEGPTVLEPARGTGAVEGFIVVRHPPVRAFAGRRPYVLALVALDEGVQLSGRLDGARPREVTVGQPVRAGFDCRAGNGGARVVFRPREPRLNVAEWAIAAG